MGFSARLSVLFAPAALLLCTALLFSSCSSTKNLPEGDKLYVGSKVNVSGDDKKAIAGLSTELKGLLRPKPNTKILGVR